MSRQQILFAAVALLLAIGHTTAALSTPLTVLQNKIKQSASYQEQQQQEDVPTSTTDEETAAKKFDLQSLGSTTGCRRNCPITPVGPPGPRGFTGAAGADGPGSTYPFASGVLPLLTVSNLTGLGLIVDIADGSSSPAAVGPLSELTETQFAFTAPRNGTLSGLDINIVAALSASQTSGNITLVAVLRQATTSSGFSDTSLQTSILLPGTTTTETRFHERDSTNTVDVLQGERYVLQLRLNHTDGLLLPAEINLALSGGVVFGAP